ncbi:MAG: histidinol dehydrogenase [Thermodesulfobacteriota bacterium]
MKIINYPSADAEERIAAIISRGLIYEKDDVDAVNHILADIKARGDDAVIEYTNRFDAPEMKIADMTVTPEEIVSAGKSVDDAFISALSRAAGQIESFHRRQLENSWFDAPRQGVILGQMVNPVSAAGIYVPGARGGTTPLVSSVLMGGIPAKIAGVKRLVMVTPPTADGSVNPHLLAAANLIGIDQVYKAGSAWAIAALTYGTKTIAPVDVIVGPGNVYVTLAKKMVSGLVGIDGVAGPSEILVIADSHADPDYIAADLLSQAEHDRMASAVLVTTSNDIARAVSAALQGQLPQLSRGDVAAASLESFGAILVVPDMEAAIEIANRIAPEHLELQVRDPFDWIGSVKNAGAVFMGAYTPEPVGDYIAGPNHVLPTAGTARFSSALSVGCFMKRTSLVYYTAGAFYDEAEDAVRLAEIEGLGAHAESMRIRMKKRQG